MVPGSMADEPKAPQSPESPKPDNTGATPAQPEAPVSAEAAPSPAAKPAAPAKPAPPPPKPPVLMQIPLDNDLTKRYREQFGAAILDAVEDRKQAYLVVAVAQLAEVARYSRDVEKFDLLKTTRPWIGRVARSVSI